MEKNKTQTLFSLLSFISGDERRSISADISEQEICELMELASKHDLSHIVAYALYEGGVVNNTHPLYSCIQNEQIQAIWRYEQTQMVFEEIKNTLEDAGIDFVPLKGSVIRDLYAEPWLRTSCDIDVLVHENDLESAAALFERLGYERKGKNYHDISLFSPSGVHLELHYNITEQISSIDRVLERVWEYCESVDNAKHEKRQSAEFLVYHLLAHMSYHFISGGCGIRPFLDIWLIESKLSYDKSKLSALCAEADLELFRSNVSALIDVWLGEREHTDITARMESFIFGGGVYGTTSNRVILEQAQSGGKTKNIIYRLFLPHYILKQRYPVLQKHKWLTPIFWVVRWFDTIKRGRLKASVNELRENNSNSDDKIKAAERFLAEVGLNPKNR